MPEVETKQPQSVTEGANGNSQALRKSASQGVHMLSVPPKVMSLTEACTYVGIAKPTMYKYLKDQTIPAFKYPGSRVWKFDRDELDSWIKKQRRSSGGESQ